MIGNLKPPTRRLAHRTPLAQLEKLWQQGSIASGAVTGLLAAPREAVVGDACEAVVEQLNKAAVPPPAMGAVLWQCIQKLA